MGIGAAVGGIASMMGGSSAASGAREAADKAEEMMEKAWQYGEESIDIADSFRTALEGIAEEYGQFAQQVWQDWEGMYGPLEKNLVNYYNNLDPTKFSTQWKANIEQELNKEFKQFQQAAAQTGLATSGMMLQAQRDQNYKQAMANAQADLMAPEYVAQQQQGFYGTFGAPQKQAAQNQLGQSILTEADLLNMGVGQQMNARNQMMNLAGQQANMYANSAAGYGQAAGNMFGQGLNMLFGGGSSGTGGLFGGLF